MSFSPAIAENQEQSRNPRSRGQKGILSIKMEDFLQRRKTRKILNFVL